MTAGTRSGGLTLAPSVLLPTGVRSITRRIRQAARALPPVVAAALVPAQAAADGGTIPTIALTEAGPDKELPTSAPFYLTGSVDPEVSVVYPVFVRVGYAPLGVGSAMSCAEARDALAVDQLRRDRNGVPLLDRTNATADIDTLWDAPSAAPGKPEPPAPGKPEPRRLVDRLAAYQHLARWHTAYVPAPWVRPENEPKDKPSKSFQVLVADTRFFRPGATFCMLTYELRRVPQSEQEKIRGKLWAHADERRRCAGDAKCESAADDKFFTELGAMLEGKLDEKGKKQVFEAVRSGLFNAAKRIDGFEKDIDRDLHPAAPPPLFARPWRPPRGMLPVEKDALARLIVEALAESGSIRSQVAPGPPGPAAAANVPSPARPVEYLTRDGKVTIRYLRVTADLTAVEVASTAEPAAADVVRVPLRAAEVTVIKDLTLEDLLRLGQGQIRVNPQEGFFSIASDLPRRLAGVYDGIRAAKRDAADLPASLPSVRPYQARIAAVRDAVVAACTARQRYPMVTATSDNAVVLQQSVDETLKTLAGLWIDQNAVDCMSLSGGGDVLRALDRDLTDFDKAVARWREDQADIRADWKKIEVTSPERVIRVSLRFTQQTFFDQFCTPFLGRAWAITPGGSIGMTYVGLHVSLFPDPIDEPMWSNGKTDAHRLLALEIGMSVESPSGDPGARYKGPGPFNPIFLGLSLQPIPYITGSAGVAFLERRASTLPEEVATLRPAFYAGIAAQLNLFTLARGAVIGRGVAVAQGAGSGGSN
ncbi:MAG: hypothetical protein QM820_00235 [Minicystis sp.]